MDITQSWQIYDHYLYAAAALFGTVIATFFLQWLVVYGLKKGKIAQWHGVSPPFLNAISVLFGLTLAFLANDTWQAHDLAKTAVFREADAIRSLVALSSSLPQPAKGKIQQAVQNYAFSAIEEWQHLAHREQDARVTDHIDALLVLTIQPSLAKVSSENIQMLLLQKINQIRNERDRRIGLSQTHVNPLKWLGMAFLGFMTLASIALVHADNFRASWLAMLLFAMAAAPTAAIVLVQGNPFQPPGAISPQPIETAVTTLFNHHAKATPSKQGRSHESAL